MTAASNQGPLRGRALRLAAFLVLAALFVYVPQIFSGVSAPGAASVAQAVKPAVDILVPNQWVELEVESAGLPVYRTDHGGAIYDPDRNSVFLFGSDTHLRDFDNRVQELRLDQLRWYQPYARTPRYTMRTDATGVRVAGGRGSRPWPMHVYDSMVYDPVQREIVVLSGPKHSFVPAPGAQLDPVWAYSASENEWSIVGEATAETPNFFAAGAVYDPTRDAIVAYASLADPDPFVASAGEASVLRTGVWELGPDRKEWHLASIERYHWGWFNVEFDVANRAMLVFGGDRTDPSIWVYEVGSAVGEPGRWERRHPDGDYCPGGFYFPAAYDDRRRVTLYMPYDRESDRTVTCVYDASRNLARRLPDADLPNVGLNYTMIYVAKEDFFLLLTGSFSSGVTTRAWVLRPDLTLLDP